MDTIQIVAEIESQIERLQNARLMLLGNNAQNLTDNAVVAGLFDSQRHPGRSSQVAPPMGGQVNSSKANKPKGITPEGRKRIAAAMKKRWARYKENDAKAKKSAA